MLCNPKKVELVLFQTLLHLEGPASPLVVVFLFLEAVALSEEAGPWAEVFLLEALCLLREELRRQCHSNPNPSFWGEAFLCSAVLLVY